MGILLYSFGLKVIELLTHLAALFNPKAKEFIGGRKFVWESLSTQLADNESPVLWVHCSSVGEYEQGRPVMECFKKQYQEYKILVTFYSPSGYHAVERDEIVDYKIYLPFDSGKNARKLLDITNPKMALFIKYEFWHYYLSELKSRQIPVFSVSSIFRRSQPFFKWYGAFNRKILDSFSYFFVQDMASQQLLKTINILSSITGDTRLDRVIKIKEQKKDLQEIDAFATTKNLMVVGSMRKEDIDIIIKFVQQHQELKFIIAPHEIIESMIQPLEESISSTVRHSNLTGSNNNQQVLIIDNIGMLSQLYRYANYAYIGGGFSDGLHNILEAAVYEIPVFFGNKEYQRFKEAIDLIDLGAAYPIGSYPELATVFRDLVDNNNRKDEIKSNLATYLAENKGASEKIIAHFEEFMP
jgi:3-deoxy-D-manno-octulosonic-acid transferase